MDEWTSAFRSEYRDRASRLRYGGIDIERSYRLWLTHLLGKRAHAVHERSMRDRPPLPPAYKPALPLTINQLEVLTLLAAGKRAPEIARRLEISEAAVADRIRTARRKTGSRQTTQLVAVAIRSGQVLAPAA